MSDTTLDFSLADLGSIKAELDKAIPALVTAIDVTKRFAAVLDPSIVPILEAAVKVLTAFESVAAKE